MYIYMYMCCYMIQYTWVFLLGSSGSSQAERNPSWPKIPLRGNHAFSLFSMDLNSPLPPKDNRRYYITARVCKVCLMILNQVDILWRCLPPNHSSWYKLLSFCFLFFATLLWHHGLQCCLSLHALSFTRCCKLRIWLLVPWFSSQSGA